MKRSLVGLFVGVMSVGAVLGLVVSSAGAATPASGRPASVGPLAKAADSASGVSPETWMRDLAGHLFYRRLSEIVIPGSHDTDTYGLSGGPPFDEVAFQYARTQNEDMTAQLNDGIREFDIRVEAAALRNGTLDYYAYHGALASPWLRFGEILKQISDWANAPGHEREIILLNLSITQNGYGFPFWTCRDFDNALGGALLTPNELQAAYGTRDPGRVTLGELWAMPGHPRVIMDNSQCMDAGTSTAAEGSAGTWSTDNPDPAQRGDLFSSYYANQCYAGNYWGWFTDFPGIKNRVLEAVKSRATQGGGDDNFPGHAVNLGPAKPGGLYTLFIQATLTASCLVPLRWFDLNEDRDVLAALYQQWLTDPDTRKNLNIVSGDFVEETDLVKDVIAMDFTYPFQGNEVSAMTPERVVARQDEQLPAGLFDAAVSYEGNPPDGLLLGPFGVVRYRVSPADGPDGPNVNGVSTHSELAWVPNRGVVKFDGLNAGPRVGTWTVTASVDGGVKDATWTLVVRPSSHFVLQPVAENPHRVEAGSTVSGGFAVRAVNAAGHPVPDTRVTFGALSGTFAGGHRHADARTDQDGIARSPAFTAGARAGATSLVAEGAAPSVALPVTVTAVRPASFVPLTGEQQTRPIERPFPVALTGHYLDRYGNVVEDPPQPFRNFVVRGSGATWPNGTGRITVTPAADGTFTLPPLRAGRAALDAVSNWDCSRVVCVYPEALAGAGWILRVTPGPPDRLTPFAGDRQRTGAGQSFARRLAVKLTDEAGNPIPGASVSFQVTSGEASFAQPNLSLLAATIGDQPPAASEQPRRRVVVPTDGQGIATPPELAAGQQPGRIEVTASAGQVAPDKRAVFTLTAT